MNDVLIDHKLIETNAIPLSELIDFKLYDKQIRIYGLDGIIKLRNSSIMIIGLAKGLGIEIIKNLSLSGIKNIFLYDTNNVTSDDLETGLYSHNDINNNRAKTLSNKLQDLNNDISIFSVETYKKNQNVTIIINKNIDFISEVNKYCRSVNSKLVVLFSGGFSGVLFVDAGINHKINQLNDEIINPIQITDITSSGIIMCFTIHNLESNDIITFNNLKGVNIDFLYKEWKINIINNKTFQLIDFEINYNFKVINGTIIPIKKSIIINHDIFINEIKNINESNFYNLNLIKTYLQLYNSDCLINIMPFIWSSDNEKFLIENNIILKDIAKINHQELIPVVSIMGALTSIETIKLITNNYRPINQWLTWFDQDLISINKPDHYNLNSSFNILYGEEYEKKLIESELLVIGLGSIGSEYLKNLALMNIGKILVTDNNEKTNLNNKFLNKLIDNRIYNNLKVFKSKFNIINLKEKVSNDNINFTNNLINSYNLNGIFNSVNNLNTKKFINEQCFNNNLPLFDVSTCGLKGFTKPMIPFLTDTSYIDIIEENDYPLCIIKNFPNDINHAIEWSIKKFEEIFMIFPDIINNWVKNPNYLENLSENDRINALEQIYRHTIKYPMFDKNIYIFIKYAIDTFIKNYYIEILQLLETYKIDHEISPGTLFWSGGKRNPFPLKFDYHNKLNLDYIESTINILLKIYNLNFNFNINDYLDYIIEYLQTINYNNLSENEILITTDLLKSCNNSFELYNLSNNSILFKKLRTKYICISSNLRANNYDITNIDHFYITGIVEKIIPSTIINSSLVSGLIILEFLKYLNNYKIYKSSFINLSESNIIYSQTNNASLIDICGVKINNWQKFTFNNLNSTIREFKNFYEGMFKTEISMIVMDTFIIFADFIQNDLDENLFNIIKNKITNNSKKIILTLLSEDDNKDLPNITINLS